MFSLKKIATVFIIGFLLSLVSGLFGGVAFLIIMLRALISGVAFVLLYFFAYTVYSRFLLNQDTVEIQGEQSASESIPNTVDIVVEDDLPDSATAPTFNLSDFVSPPVAESQPVMEPLESASTVEVPQENSAFQASPLNLITKNDEISGEDLSPVEELSESESIASNLGSDTSELPADRPSFSTFEQEDISENDDTDLGELPDMDSIGVDEDDEGLGSSDDLIQDSVFAETGAIRPSSEPVAVSELGDAKDIAAAIRTAMVKDA